MMMTSRNKFCGFGVGALAFGAALFATVGAASAGAQPAGLADRVLSQPVQPRPGDCQNGNMIVLKLCAAADFRAADMALNGAYQKARAQCQDDANRALLLAAQRAWLALRDATCDWESDFYRDGSMSGLASLSCLERITRERITYIEHAFTP